MKKIWSLMFLLLCIGSLHAQTFDEWFRQKKTQIKYLVDQIAALEVYAGYLEKGYKIAREGIRTIHDIKNGEFELHKSYFNSLKMVNPSIARYARIGDIIANQLYVLNHYKKYLLQATKTDVFTDEEIDLFYAAFTHLVAAVKNSVEELVQVITDGKLEMKDDERLQRLEKLYATSEKQRSDLDVMNDQITLMGHQRILEKSGLNGLKYLYDLK